MIRLLVSFYCGFSVCPYCYVPLSVRILLVLFQSQILIMCSSVVSSVSSYFFLFISLLLASSVFCVVFPVLFGSLFMLCALPLFLFVTLVPPLLLPLL